MYVYISLRSTACYEMALSLINQNINPTAMHSMTSRVYNVLDTLNTPGRAGHVQCHLNWCVCVCVCVSVCSDGEFSPLAVAGPPWADTI